MKMKLITLSALCILTSFASAQTLLYNNGATIKIQTGATLYVEGGVDNVAGTVDNDGTLDIKGDFTNTGTWLADSPNTLKFSGAAHSNVNSGSAQFHDVVIQKEHNYIVKLTTTDMTINNNLNFNTTGSTRIVTDNRILKLGSAATVTGVDSSEYVATNSTGMMEKAVTGNGSFTFPIGDLANYTPLANVYTGTSYTSATLSARSNDAIHPNIPGDASDYISRYWDINQVGIADYANTLTGTYATSGDIVGTSSLIKGAVHNGSAWSYVDASNGTGTVIAKTTHANSDFTGSNFFGKVDLKVFLHASYNNTTGVMNTTLNNLGIIPLTSPYTDAPATVTSIPSGVTDWIKVELREVGNPSNILGKASVFLKSDGKIVGLDGTSLPLIKNGNPLAIVGIKHRNHLGIRTPNDSILNVVNPILYDFSLDSTKAYDNPSITTNNAMRLMGNGKYVMWGGNANALNGNTQVRYTTSAGDEPFLLSKLGGNTATIITGSAAYHGADMSLNGVIRYTTSTGDEPYLLSTLGGNTAKILNQHQ